VSIHKSGGLLLGAETFVFFEPRAEQDRRAVAGRRSDRGLARPAESRVRRQRTLPAPSLRQGHDQAAPGYLFRVEDLRLAPWQGDTQVSQPYRANGILGWTGNLSEAATFTAAPGGAEQSTTFTLFSTFNRAAIAIDPVTVQVSDVPEPTTWMLMILGVGLIARQALQKRAGCRLEHVERDASRTAIG
jgi:hypothetical protein